VPKNILAQESSAPLPEHMRDVGRTLEDAAVLCPRRWRDEDYTVASDEEHLHFPLCDSDRDIDGHRRAIRRQIDEHDRFFHIAQYEVHMPVVSV